MTEENERIVHRGIDELWNGGRMEIIAEITGPGYVRHDPSLPHPANGPHELEQSVALLRHAFPDLNEEIVEMHSAGDVVVTRWRATGNLGVIPKRESAQEKALRRVSNLRTKVTRAIGR